MFSDSPEEAFPQDMLNSEKTCIQFLSKESFFPLNAGKHRKGMAHSILECALQHSMS